MTPEQKQKAQAVAGYFNLPPQGDPCWGQERFTLPDGGSLNFGAPQNGKGNRLSIHAWCNHELQRHAPSYYDKTRPCTEITVSMDKTVEQICREIKSRLMPGYKQHHAACKANKERAEQDQADRLDRLNAVAHPLGLQAEATDTNYLDTKELTCRNRVGLWLSAKPYCDGIKLEIETTKEIAGKIAALLAELCPISEEKE